MPHISPYLRWSGALGFTIVFTLFFAGAFGPIQYNAWPVAGVALLYWTLQGAAALQEQNSDDIRMVLAVRRVTQLAFWLVPLAIVLGVFV